MWLHKSQQVIKNNVVWLWHGLDSSNTNVSLTLILILKPHIVSLSRYPCLTVQHFRVHKGDLLLLIIIIIHNIYY